MCKISSSSIGSLNRIINDLIDQKKIKMIKNGNRYKQFEILDNYQKKIINIDLFIVFPPAQWGVIFLLRTGDAEFSKRFVTEIKPKYRIKGGHLEKLHQIDDEMGKRKVYSLVRTPTEKSVFKRVGWDYIKPKERTY